MKNNKSMFSTIRKSKTIKFIMAFTAINLLVEIAFPTFAMALTAGAASPEFASFEPVATTDMVNDFTGDFTYNLPVLSVPGPDGGGYSMSLSYHSGGSSEEEASWVGHGWTLNPGAINRQKRGFADDFKDIEVKKYNKQYPNWTHTSSFNMNIEAASSDNEDDNNSGDKKGGIKAVSFLGIPLGDNSNKDDKEDDEALIQPSVSFSKSIRYNNYTGFAITTGFGVGPKGMGSVNMNRTGGESTLGINIDPIGILARSGRKKTKKIRDESKIMVYTRDHQNKLANKANRRDNVSNAASRGPSVYSSWSFNAPSIPYSVAYNAGRSYNYSSSLGIEVFTVGFQFGLRGNMNFQANQPEVTTRAYGYMYTPLKSENEDLIGEKYPHNLPINESDFQIEKESTFNKHDKNLGIPFNNADVFTATGNGVIGGFKFYHEHIGHSYPTFVTNKQKIIQAGVEVAVGQTIAVGLDAGLGFQETKVQDWRAVEGDDAEHYFDQKPAYLAFNGDMGGQVQYTDLTDEDILHATVGGGYMNRKLNIDNLNNATTDLDRNIDGKSSRVTYEYESSSDKIASIEVTNKDGNISKYEKTIKSRDEYELTVGLLEQLYDGDQLTQGYTVQVPVNVTNPMDEKTAVGQRILESYASTFLLTENTTFDYVDLTNNGPTPDDFGGWTKFDYRHIYGENADGDNNPANDEYYQYRAPYTGVIYDRGRLIDGNDQSGSVSTGKKEVKYLSAVETKTHVAFFITNRTGIDKTIENEYPIADYPFLYDGGSNFILGNDLDGSAEIRTDGIDAEINNGGKSSNPHYLEKLERIVLYSKNDLSKPISTTYFKFDYSLCKGIPNTTTPSNGKLTLKKVWTESGGTIKSKVAPYQFDYNYHIYTEASILSKYPAINENYEFTFLPQNDPNYLQAQEEAQNPLFQEGLLDPWGSYRLEAEKRFRNMQPWVDQYNYNGVFTNSGLPFDAGAWQLKQIKLPSGGEIHIQYEQKDYRFVQDKPAMAMTSLMDGHLAKNGYKSGKDDNGNPENRYYIDLNSVGFNSNEQSTYAVAKDRYKQILQDHFVGRKNKLYFKMLYTYFGGTVPNLNVHNHNVDYITGYCAVNKVDIDPVNNEIYLELGELKSNGDGKKDKTLPRYVGYQKFLTSAHRNIGWSATDVEQNDEDLLEEAYNNGNTIVTESDIQSLANKLAKENTFNFFGDWVDAKIANESIKQVCEELNYDLSYFKLPMYNPKKGGGIRVKRLISYDPGISGENGDAMIYGSEYIYKNEDGLSSGVATNEPQLIREENALVGILERNKQSGWDKTFNGRDSKQYEGPLGESLLPGSQVVHERVIIKNIHSGRTTTGYAVNKYHTSKDFPMRVDFSELSKDGDDPTYKKYNLSLPLGIINLNFNKAWVTQGYLFKLNDMNGKIESQATYAGNYQWETFKEAAYTSKTTYSYSKPGEAIETLVYDPTQQDFTLGSLKLGQEEDITMYRSRVRDVTNDFSLELDINFLLQLYPALTLGFGLSYAYSQNELSQHVTSRVLRQKTFLRSTTTTTDGVTQITRNIAFDKYTGDPVLTKTFDGYMDPNDKIHTEQGGSTEHNGNYYALNIPASWIYKEMGAKDADPNTNLDDDYSNQLTASVGNIVTYGEDILSKFNSGIWNPNTNKLTRVVNSSATVYKKDWFSNYAPSHEINKHYYPHRTYVYRDQVKDANSQEKIYGGGIMANDFNFFNNWNFNNNGISTIGNWYSASEITEYSENGYPIEEKDVLGINSAAKFGYSSTLPILVAQNAKQEQVHFIDFEGTNNSSNLAIVSTNAHSGNGSFDLTANPNQIFVGNYNINGALLGEGISIKLWLKSTLSNNPSSTSYGLRNPNPNLKAKIGGQLFSFARVAQTGDWGLYVANIKNFNGLSIGLYDLQLSYNFLTNEEVLIDDYRVQPLESVMNCTVYGKDNKVVAQFDDQHFGVFYEYNNKEQLVRKSIETERGKKTLQEQQYNTPLIYR